MSAIKTVFPSPYLANIDHLTVPGRPLAAERLVSRWGDGPVEAFTLTAVFVGTAFAIVLRQIARPSRGLP
jgi:hypothetical protein